MARFQYVDYSALKCQRGDFGQKPKPAPFCMKVQPLTRHFIKLDPFLGGGVVLQLQPPAGAWQTTKKKEERGLKQRRKQKEAAQGDPEPKKGNQEKEKKTK